MYEERMKALEETRRWKEKYLKAADSSWKSRALVPVHVGPSRLPSSRKIFGSIIRLQTKLCFTIFHADYNSKLVEYDREADSKLKIMPLTKGSTNE
jgi:hypothetical protein